MAKAKAYKNLIAGEWVKSTSGRTFENRNPADQRELIGSFQDSTADDIDQAVAAACQAYSTVAANSSAQKG